MSGNIAYFLQSIAPFASVFAAALGALAAAFSTHSAIRYTRSKRQLEKNIKWLEIKSNANVADVTDRELRRIVVQLDKYRNDTPTKSLVTYKPHRGRDRGLQDYVIFWNAFEKLPETHRKVIANNISNESSIERIKYVRNLLTHAHSISEGKLTEVDPPLLQQTSREP
jgi:hypothetical protein